MSNNNTSNVVNKVDEIKRALSSEKKAKNLQPIKTYGNLMDVVNKTNYEGNADFGDEDIANVAAVLLQLQIMNQSEVPDKPLPPMIPPSPNVQTFGRRMKLAKAKSPVNSADKVSDNASAKEDGNELSNSFQIMMDNFSEGKSLDTLTTKTLIDTRISIKRSSHAQSTSELSSKMPMEITSPLEQQKATSSQELVETRKKSSSQDSNLEIQRKHSQNLYDRVRKTSQDRARKDSQKSLENEESKPEMLIPHSEVEETALNNNPESPSKTPSTPWSRNEFTIDSPNSAIKSPGDDINQANRFMMPRLSSISRGSSSSKIEKVQFSSLPRNGNSMKSLNNLAPENAEGEVFLH